MKANFSSTLRVVLYWLVSIGAAYLCLHSPEGTMIRFISGVASGCLAFAGVMATVSDIFLDE